MNSLYRELHTSQQPNFIDGINQILQQNPQLKSIINMVKSGGNPKQMFYEMAKLKGVDPNSILSSFK